MRLLEFAVYLTAMTCLAWLINKMPKDLQFIGYVVMLLCVVAVMLDISGLIDIRNIAIGRPVR